MKNTRCFLRRISAFLLALLLAGMFCSAYAASDPLKPAPIPYENGNIILSKQAERVGPEEWVVTVTATVGHTPVQKREVEVVFLLDISSSMKEKAHTHTNECRGSGNSYICGYNTCTRLEVATIAAERLISNLPPEVKVTRLTFDGGFSALKDSQTYYDVKMGSGTYMYTGIVKTFNGSYFSKGDSKKIFVILTDGESSSTDKTNSKESALSLLTTFKDPKQTDGAVFTVGFDVSTSVQNELRVIAGNGGNFLYAENASDMEVAFEQIEYSITAMLEDPMGDSVGFDKDNIVFDDSEGNGSISAVGDTIYWHPSGDSVADQVISYSYNVALNENADYTPGQKEGVPLNAPTYFKYGVNDGDASQMKSAAFPIPHASYGVATLQANWKYRNTNLQAATSTEKLVTGYTAPDHVQAFKTNYDIVQNFPQTGKNYYLYENTTVSIDGTTYTVTTQEALDALIDPNQPHVYVVTHNYVLKEAYDVVYQYTGQVPAGAPALDALKAAYAPNSTVPVDATVPAVTLPGYTFSGWSVAQGGAVIGQDGTFAMPGNDVLLQGSWIAGHRLYVKHVFSDGSGHDGFQAEYQLYSDTYYQPDDSWSVTPPTAPEGYQYVAAESGEAASSTNDAIAKPGVVSGESFGTKDRYIILTYQPLERATATVHFVDADGNPLQTDVTDEQYVGTHYNVSSALSVDSITINGVIYDFASHNAADADYAAAMPEGGVEITRVYAERGKATATVHFKDANGTSLQDAMTDEQYIGIDYNVSSALNVDTINVNGVIYDFVGHNAADADYAAAMPEGGVDITRVYAERGKGIATVHFVDANGTSLQDAMTDEQYIGIDYNVSSALSVDTINVNGVIYDFVSHNAADADYAAAMPEGGVEITRVYAERGKGIATVHFVDEQGNTLLDDLLDTQYIGTTYDVTDALSIQTITANNKQYIYASHTLGTASTPASDADYTSAMPAGGVEITRVYNTSVFYYQTLHEYKLYDAKGTLVYSGSELFPVMSTTNLDQTMEPPLIYTHNGKVYNLTSEATQTANLLGTTPEMPYVFVNQYVLRLPAVYDGPPQTGDTGYTLWLGLMLSAAMGLGLLLPRRRKG